VPGGHGDSYPSGNGRCRGGGSQTRAAVRLGRCAPSRGPAARSLSDSVASAQRCRRPTQHRECWKSGHRPRLDPQRGRSKMAQSCTRIEATEQSERR
jgi:hypothetical protein